MTRRASRGARSSIRGLIIMCDRDRCDVYTRMLALHRYNTFTAYTCPLIVPYDMRSGDHIEGRARLLPRAPRRFPRFARPPSGLPLDLSARASAVQTLHIHSPVGTACRPAHPRWNHSILQSSFCMLALRWSIRAMSSLHHIRSSRACQSLITTQICIGQLTSPYDTS